MRKDWAYVKSIQNYHLFSSILINLVPFCFSLFVVIRIAHVIEQILHVTHLHHTEHQMEFQKQLIELIKFKFISNIPPNPKLFIMSSLLIFHQLNRSYSRVKKWKIKSFLWSLLLYSLCPGVKLICKFKSKISRDPSWSTRDSEQHLPRVNQLHLYQWTSISILGSSQLFCGNRTRTEIVPKWR